ncbi:unnamed protein product [Victoria cruziana]
MAALALPAVQFPQLLQWQMRREEAPFVDGVQTADFYTTGPSPWQSSAHSFVPETSAPPLMQGLIRPPFQTPTLPFRRPHDIPFHFSSAPPDLSQYNSTSECRSRDVDRPLKAQKEKAKSMNHQLKEDGHAKFLVPKFSVCDL